MLSVNVIEQWYKIEVRDANDAFEDLVNVCLPDLDPHIGTADDDVVWADTVLSTLPQMVNPGVGMSIPRGAVTDIV
jgi:hypothetical protein